MKRFAKNAARAFIAFVTAALVVVGIGALSAYAYIEKHCAVFVTARMSISGWSVGPTTSKVHLDLNSYLPSSGLKMYQQYIKMDGVNLGQSEDFYANVNNTVAHSFQGWWIGSNGSWYMCPVSFASNTLK